MIRNAPATRLSAARGFPFLSWLFLGLLTLAVAGQVRGATLPELPRANVDTTYAPPSGNTITVNSGGNLQTAINNAQLGDTIVLQAGATFTGPFTLPGKTGSGWIHIRSSAYANLPAPGTRVSPADATNMPKIVVSDQVGAAIRTGNNAHHYRFVGIEVRPAAGKFVYELISIGNGDTSVSTMPTDIVFDRCYIHGDPGVGGRRGVAMNGIRVAVIDSYVSDFKEVGADTQAIWTYNSPGPLKIYNNYLEAAGENFMAGGADPKVTNLVPSDIEIRRNHFFKPLAWISQSWTVKNLLEFKNAQRVLVEGNVFENNWPASQNGLSILVTPRNQDGGAPWSITQDIAFRSNKLVNVGQGFNVSGRDGNYSSQITRRVAIENNLIFVSRLQGADGRIFQVIGGPVDVTVRHNTGVITVNGGTTAFSENNPPADQFDFRDNLLSHGSSGFAGTGTGGGFATLNTYFSNYAFTKNAIIAGGSSSSYPAGNYFPASTAVVAFVNSAGGDYRLSTTSPYRNAASDGKDIGADINALESLIACVPSGYCGSEPPPAGGPPVIPGATNPPRLANNSTRAQVSTGNDALIGGFVIGGTQPKTVVVRARGPSLSAAGVPGALANPFLQLYAGPTQIAVNDNWQEAANAATLRASGFAPANAFEAAIYTTLAPGAYTAIVTGVGGTTGVGIIEVFEVDQPQVPLVNISTRSRVLTGNDVMIGGFIIQGDGPQTVIVRARGPSLAAAGVPGVLANPVLQLFSGATQIAVNDNWQESPSAVAIQSAGFAPASALESAIRITLGPGAYTAIVTGAGGTTGVGIVEVFAQ